MLLEVVESSLVVLLGNQKFEPQVTEVGWRMLVALILKIFFSKRTGKLQRHRASTILAVHVKQLDLVQGKAGLIESVDHFSGHLGSL